MAKNNRLSILSKKITRIVIQTVKKIVFKSKQKYFDYDYSLYNMIAYGKIKERRKKIIIHTGKHFPRTSLNTLNIQFYVFRDFRLSIKY